MHENLTFWLGVLGSITGCASLVLYIWRFLEDLPRLNIYFPPDYHNKCLVGHAIDLNHRDEYGNLLEDKTRFIFYIWSRITNNSEKPITLLEISLQIKGFETTYLDSSSFCIGSVPVGKNTTRKLNTIKPIITLEPYSAIEGYLFFGDYYSVPPDNTRAKLIIVTSRKTFNVKLNLHLEPPPE